VLKGPPSPGVLDITFSTTELVDVVPHKDDPILLLVVLMGRNVHRVLIDQGSSTNVMFWDTSGDTERATTKV